MKADKAVLKAFKGAKTREPGKGVEADAPGKALEAALKELRSEATREAVSSIHRYLHNRGRGEADTFPKEGLATLVTQRLAESAEFVFGEVLPELAQLRVEEILPLASTPKALAMWVTAREKLEGGKEGEERKEMVALVQADPEAATRTVLAHWFVSNASSDELPMAVEILRTGEGGRWFVSRSVLLATVLDRDRDGSFMVHYWKHLLQDPVAMDREVKLLRSDGNLYDKVLRVFPVALEKDSEGNGVKLLGHLFSGLGKYSANERRQFSARLTRLAATFLAMNDLKHANAALRELDRISQEMGEAIPSGVVDPEVCGIRYYGREREGKGTIVSEQGAVLMALAMEKVQSGMDAKGVLEATAFNLGMREIERVGDRAAFDPVNHEDVHGGLRPDEVVEVVAGGWKLGEQVIRRAKVKRS